MTTELYPVDEKIQKELEEMIDPETGEIMDMEAFEQSMAKKPDFSEGLKETLINRVRRSVVIQKTIKDEVEKLKRMLEVEKNYEKSNLSYLKHIIETDGDINFITVKAKIQKNPASVVIDDKDKLKKYITVELIKEEKLDKNQLKADLKALKEGKKIEGAHLEQGTRVVIK